MLLLVKFLTADPLLICGLRSIIAGITLMPFIRWKRLNWTPWMVVYISSYCALCISIILALAKTSAAIAIGMQYTATIWLFLANLIITRKFNKKAFWPVCVIFAGVIFFMCSGTDNSSSSGNMIALLEGIFFAFMSVGAKKSAGTNPLGLTAIANLVTGVFVFTAFPSTAGYMGTAVCRRLDGAAHSRYHPNWGRIWLLQPGNSEDFSSKGLRHRTLGDDSRTCLGSPVLKRISDAACTYRIYYYPGRNAVRF